MKYIKVKSQMGRINLMDKIKTKNINKTMRTKIRMANKMFFRI
jgi:hypothetical protein